MSKFSFFLKRLVRMDWKAMWKTAGMLRKPSGKSRLWLLADMLRCALKYNAGYVDYKIAQMYRLNDAQRKTQVTLRPEQPDRKADERQGVLVPV